MLKVVSENAPRPALLAGFDTRQQLASNLGVSPLTILKWEARGLPVIRRGRLRFYDHSKVRAWLGLNKDAAS